jgi:UDP-N-acetylmuramoyl-L-alanyl-D-glutamate--2,6-diaminopimelate ligase
VKWEEIASELGVRRRGGEGNPDISGVCYDSRVVGAGCLFVAVPGLKTHGDRFIDEAIAAGAVAVLSENEQPDCRVPWAQVTNAREAVGRTARSLWARDVQVECMIAVTGTNGKTTTAGLFHDLLTRRYGPRAAWMFGTISYQVNGETMAAPNTTPESADIFRMIGTSATRPSAIVMEASSHALQLQRLAGLDFDLAVWTNLTQDHLDFHKTLEAYYAAKKRLFDHHMRPGGSAVINIDDEWGKRLYEECGALTRLSFGEHQSADVRIVDWTCDWSGSTLTVQMQGTPQRLTSALTGSFNRFNMAAFCAGALALGYSVSDMQATLSSVTRVPGRMERVALDAPFTVVVDYAHTPDALSKLLATVRELTPGRVLTVFGCGGDRDRAKRPIMGEAVARASDEAVVTSDNPRTEEPGAILDDILRGIPRGFPHEVAVQRVDAIRLALSKARRGDTVVVAGKGHETYQEINGTRYPFDDKQVVGREYGALMEQTDRGC